MKSLTFLPLLSIATLATAHAATAPDFTVSMAAKDSKVEVTALPPAAHHFNIEAPMNLEDTGANKPLKPKSAKKDKVVFQLAGTQARKITVTLYLCDDPNTYCEKHVVTANWDGPAKGASSAPKAAPQKTATQPAPAVFHGAAKQGFLTDPVKALEQAERQNKPLMISFFAIWCPPCNMLDREVISTKEFGKASADFVKLRLDVDSEASWPLKERYKIGGYPTVVFANAKGDETLRVVGYRPQAQFLAEMKTAWDLRSETLAGLRDKANAGDANAAKRIGLIHFERKEYRDAIKYLEQASDTQSRETALQAKVSLAEEEDNKSELKKLLETFLSEHADSPYALPRQVQLAGVYKEENQLDKATALYKAAAKHGEALVKTPQRLKGYDMMVPDVLYYVAEAYGSLEDKVAARKAWTKVAAEYRKRIKGDPADRGNNLELGHAIAHAGMINEADAHFRKLERKYPQEHTFYYNHAHMLFNTAKDAKKAEPVAAKAFEYAYGDNKIRAAMMLAKIKDALGDATGALKIARETLSEVKLPDDKFNRTHRYHKQLKAQVEALEKKTS